jgi:formate dehydrogenase iron-sulfur subunit
VRNQFVDAFSGKNGFLFLAEIILGGIVPILLLSQARLRMRRAALFAACLLAAAGVILNRVNVVLLAMDLRGPMPQNAPAHYMPSMFEWGISIGLIAATIILFQLGVRYLPVLPKAHKEAG